MKDSERLLQLIEDKGFENPKQFSIVAGVPYKTFYNIIKRSPRVSNTSHDNFKAIANALGMDSDSLYDALYNED